MMRPLHEEDEVHEGFRLLAQQTSPEAHVCVPHLGPPVPPLLLPLEPLTRQRES
jgi:hypothetical protein